MNMEEIAKQVVNGWMNSPGHRANILNGRYDREGIGVAVSSDEKVYFTQDFCLTNQRSSNRLAGLVSIRISLRNRPEEKGSKIHTVYRTGPIFRCICY
jgi:hypothetical protein